MSQPNEFQVLIILVGNALTAAVGFVLLSVSMVYTELLADLVHLSFDHKVELFSCVCSCFSMIERFASSLLDSMFRF